MTAYYDEDVATVLERLHCDAATGLSGKNASARFEEFGANELVERGQRSPWAILREQLSGAMIMLLYAAAGVSVYLGELRDAVAILTIILLNAILGFVQDYRAEKALAALKRLAMPVVRVRRDGRNHEIPSSELVPGDIVLLETGNLVPADCRLIEIHGLQIRESALTGESDDVEKTIDRLNGLNMPIGDQTNMAWMGTVVTYGRGEAVVTDTGMATQLGQIASSLQSVQVEPTPLQRRLGQLGRTLAIVAVGIVAVVFVVGLASGETPKLMLMTALSLAVAVVPEGLPAVATVALAIGARRMVQRNALIRKLPAVETLGSVTVICSDKTGTLTQNRMTVSMLDVAGQRLDVSANEDATNKRDQHPSIELLLIGAALCNDAEIVFDDQPHAIRSIGEPTEAALMDVVCNMGINVEQLRSGLPRVSEVPFDSTRKRMTTVHRADNRIAESPDVNRLVSLLNLEDPKCVGFTKGAVDRVLNASSYVWSDEQPTTITSEWQDRIGQAHDELAGRGMRVLGVAMRILAETPTADELDAVERELIFIGMMAIVDPPRPEVRAAVERCRLAGIRPVMITGDHPLTAAHIAEELGILSARDASRSHKDVLTGQQLTDMSAEDLQSVVEDVSVFARVAPIDKLHIVQALQHRNHVVAMTGDGVNDAPALKQAHIGVAMGIMGTDVSKEAADMVLVDDNFSTIVNAVEEGRIVYDNIRKFIRYTMTSNAGEICVMLLGTLLGMPLALIPLQILWINLVTDGLPGLALAFEPAERSTMRRDPYPPGEHIMGRGMAWDIAWIGLLMGVVSIAMGYWSWSVDKSSDTHWRTIVFTVLTLSQMGNALATRSERDSLFRIGVFSNKAMLGSVLLTFILQLLVVYAPPMQVVFKTEALSIAEL